MSIKAWIEQNSTETAQFEDFVRNLNGLGAENQNDSAMGTGIFFKGYANPALGTYELCFNNGPEYPAKLFTPDERQAWYDKIATCFPSLETIEVETYGQERMLKIQSSGVDFVALESVLTEWNNAAAEKSKSLTKFIQSLQSESIAIVCGKSHSHIVPQKELKNDGQFSKLMADVTEKEIKSPLIQACFVSNNEPSIFRIWDKNFYNYEKKIIATLESDCGFKHTCAEGSFKLGFPNYLLLEEQNQEKLRDFYNNISSIVAEDKTKALSDLIKTHITKEKILEATIDATAHLLGKGLKVTLKDENVVISGKVVELLRVSAALNNLSEDDSKKTHVERTKKSAEKMRLEGDDLVVPMSIIEKLHQHFSSKEQFDEVANAAAKEMLEQSLQPKSKRAIW